MMRVSLFALALLAGPATAETLNFCWTGANGYTMTGRMTIAETAMARTIVTERDVTGFKIAGYHRGQLLGTWDMATRAPSATWHLRFDPLSLTFLTGGSFSGTNSQGWNADGNVENCGNPGFGFNSGNYAQDICLNGVYVADSSIDPATPLRATRAAVSPRCQAAMPLSKTNNTEK
ncbi:hypothetical protein SAMN05428995_10748 [Loktanella sp. DSM 29012]|uniref:hypothetical protein n=1 Tax=Loktanella sp. DSM 29012 TaxID=1881056 RepID=UPI0008B77B16|nr:hypothetical protein [Loktanella sp. DSM 29012]SEQ73592.1 hypothetical protein SAMN05428995_10748 [Loktanella sp. DSM 29012]